MGTPKRPKATLRHIPSVQEAQKFIQIMYPGIHPCPREGSRNRWLELGTGLHGRGSFHREVVL